MIERYTKNEQGHDYVVGDVHGCYSRLDAELRRIGFDAANDRLFSVGDLVDRGPENGAVLDWLRLPWFHAVMGNHDDMALRWPLGNMQGDIYRSNGGGWNMDQPVENQEKIALAMSALPIAIEVETSEGVVGIVHADVPYDTWSAFADALGGKKGNAEARHAADMAMWSRGRITSENRWGVQGVRAVVCGHTPLTKPVQLGNVYHIDTGAVFGGQFTILDLVTLEPV